MQTGSLTTDSPVRALSWNLEGTRLLTAGAQVQLWHLNHQQPEKEPVVFTLGGGDSNTEYSGFGDQSPDSQGDFLFHY